MRGALKRRPVIAVPVTAPLTASVAAPVAAPAYVFQGHSGARVEFHPDAKLVRKTAAAPHANDRLQAQSEKQRRLFMLGLPFPRVLAERVNKEGCAEFDMQYLPGRSLADAVSKAAIFDPGTVVKSVERMMWLFAPAAGLPLAPHFFQNKIRAIAQEASGDVRQAAARLSALNWRGIPESPCHGDLTLENMLITTAKTVAFIDCDEAWVSSYWLDFGKLFQDIEGHWCLRRLYAPQVPQAQRVNAIQKMEPLGRAFRALAARTDTVLLERLPQLAALGLLRAIPYAKDPDTIAFICKRIAHLLEKAS
ncbi:MAG TPA: phosphotransferase [Rhizomicrobium sp.]|nr:phosphotransferase [Rhizomicrobium sp.]